MTAAHAYELPSDDGPLAEAVHDVEDGNVVYLTRRGRRVAALVPADQAWFWTPEWQAGEREADADIAAGRTMRFTSTEEMDAYLAGIPLPSR